MNNTNIEFYENIDVDTFKSLAHKRGMDKCEDIDILYPHIKNAKVIADLGSGYGRAISAMLKKGFKGQLFAVERVSHLQEYMRKLFKQNVDYIQQDIKELNLPKKADVILWLGSGIIEFSKNEIHQTLFKIKTNLKKNGILIIDFSNEVPNLEVDSEKIKLDIQKTKLHYKLACKWGVMNNFLPTCLELTKNCEKLNFKKMNVIKYNLNKGFTRNSYFFFN